MKHLSLDLETFSSVDIGKTGVYKYAESPDFEILLLGYSVDGGEVHVVDLTQGEAVPGEIIDALTDDTVTKWAFNCQFERVCLSRWLQQQGLPLHNDYYSIPEDSVRNYLDPSSWRCSMIWSAYLGLPLSLASVGAALGLEQQKMTEGKDLIRYFCMPCAPTQTNGQRMRNRPADAPDKWATFVAYNKRDVEVEQAIQERLKKFPVPEAVWEQYHLDQEINDRGIRVDAQLVDSAIAMDARSNEELTQKMQELTMLDNPNSVAQMKKWLADNGMETDSLGKKQVAGMLTDAPEPLRSVLMLRQQLAKSSVKKYIAMKNCMCNDGRIRGMFQFYGANRSGRWAGRNVQLQNLSRNDMPDLDEARELIKSGDYSTARMLYDSVPDVLSQLIRTALIPREGCQFIVADFSAIEARVIAWLAGEEWRMELFRKGGDIYCQSASQMFKVPVEKHGINGHLRQKGKIAELACIAEDSLVLTDHGLIPIQTVTKDMLVWDGENWVHHEGVVYRGEREVITYDGLTATPDHLVWVEGKSQPIQFGIAAACGTHLVQTGNGGRAIRLGDHHFSGKAVEQGNESLLCADKVFGMRHDSMAELEQFENGKIERLSTMLPTKTCSEMAGKTVDSCQTTLRKSSKFRVSKLWRERNKVRIPERNSRRIVSSGEVWSAGQENGDRQDRHKWQLCLRQSAFCRAFRELRKSTQMRFIQILTRILAIFIPRGDSETVSGIEQRRNHTRCGESRIREAKKLATHQRTARLYDIRNAGPNHRFTVSNRLVHNCGYGGSVGALKAMGALEMGLQEEELKPLVDAWRSANPKIVKLWWDVDAAVTKAVREKTKTETHGLVFTYQSAMLFITLPSGRQLSYVMPRIGENQFGSPAVTYMGIGATKKWERIESYGPKFVENCVQGISRDILCYAMNTLRHCFIVAHVHDEIIIEANPRMSLEAVCEQMGRTPPWAEGLILRADGYTCSSYRKD